MTQPRFSPIPIEDEVRPVARLGAPHAWWPDRPGELRASELRHAGRGGSATSKGRGVPGPDQGYALLLAERFAKRLVLEDGEDAEDVLAVAVAIGLRRASVYGRAPVATDLEVALGLFGYLSSAPPELVAYRKAAVGGLAHDEWARRELALQIPEASLRRAPSALSPSSSWGELLGA